MSCSYVVDGELIIRLQDRNALLIEPAGVVSTGRRRRALTAVYDTHSCSQLPKAILIRSAAAIGGHGERFAR